MDYQIMPVERLGYLDLERLSEAGMADGALPVVLYDGPVTPVNFREFARRPDVAFAAVRRGREWLGFFYLTNLEGRVARIHFCSYRAARGDIAGLGRMALEWCFRTFELQALIGAVPVINGGAVAYARAMGGREMGRVPGMCWIERLRRAVDAWMFLFLPEKED